jgi:hypothetical protein
MACSASRHRGLRGVEALAPVAVDCAVPLALVMFAHACAAFLPRFYKSFWTTACALPRRDLAQPVHLAPGTQRAGGEALLPIPHYVTRCRRLTRAVHALSILTAMAFTYGLEQPRQ